MWTDGSDGPNDKKTSKSLSDSMLGPVALIFGALLVNYLREKMWSLKRISFIY